MIEKVFFINRNIAILYFYIWNTKSFNIPFHNKKLPKENVPWKCLPIIMLDSVIKRNKKYYPQTLSEECKYVQEKTKTENLLHDYLAKSESDSDSNDETKSDIDNDE